MPTKEDVLKALKNVLDPELGVNIVDLGLVYEVLVGEDGIVKIKMTLTTPGCPLGHVLERDIQTHVGALSGVKEIDVKIVWEPPWTPERMTADGKAELEFLKQS